MALRTPAEVLEFWFGAPGSETAGRARPEWFRKDESFDTSIRTRFGDTLAAALDGRLDEWRTDPRPALARLILLDQFTRNAFRGTPAAFSGDARALAAARGLVASGWHRSYAPLERWFCYLPFEHSEALDDQREALRLFALLRDDPQAGAAYEWAVRHHDVIARFGRFPHRNAILGRSSTDDEIVFLREPGSSF